MISPNRMIYPTGLQGITDLLSPLMTEGEGAQVHLYHHVSVSETVMTVGAAGLAFYLIGQILKYKKR